MGIADSPSSLAVVWTSHLSSLRSRSSNLRISIAEKARPVGDGEGDDESIDDGDNGDVAIGADKNRTFVRKVPLLLDWMGIRGCRNWAKEGDRRLVGTKPRTVVVLTVIIITITIRTSETARQRVIFLNGIHRHGNDMDIGAGDRIENDKVWVVMVVPQSVC